MNDDDSYDMILVIIVLMVISFLFGFLFGSSSSVTTTPSYFTGTVVSIYNNSPSYIQFTSGNKYYGNLANVTNVSINAICKLEIVAPPQYEQFLKGTCTT